MILSISTLSSSIGDMASHSSSFAARSQRQSKPTEGLLRCTEQCAAEAPGTAADFRGSWPGTTGGSVAPEVWDQGAPRAEEA